LEVFITSKIEKGELSKLDVINVLKKLIYTFRIIVIQEKEEEIFNRFIDILDRLLKVSPDEVRKIEEKGKETSVNIEFEHTVNQAKYTLPIELESQGTRRFYGLQDYWYS